VACVAFLAITVLATTRGRREPLAARLAVLCLVLFAYTAFDLIGGFVPAEPLWTWLDSASVALATPAFFHFTITFLGRRSDLGRLVIAAYAYFGAIALGSLAPIVVPAMTTFPGGSTWALLILAGLAPTVAFGVVMLLRHAKESAAEERARTSLVLGCTIVTTVGAATDLSAMGAGMSSPGVASWALVVSALLLTAAALRTRTLERVSVLVGTNVAALALVVVLGELALFWAVGSRAALMVVGSAIVVLLALLAGRYLLRTTSEGRARANAEALLGRMSRQMAHDLRNPLAAIRGAAEYLQAEHTAGHSFDAQGPYLQLVVDQTDRMARVIEQYQRLGQVEPTLADAEVNALVRAASQSFAQQVELDLAPELSPCRADAELVTMALENVIRNATDALRTGGVVRVRTAREADGTIIDIEDDGVGMNARTRDRAFEEFYTTKATGSGIGLSFVKRVVDAHGWRVLLDSREGIGTKVRVVVRNKT